MHSGMAMNYGGGMRGMGGGGGGGPMPQRQGGNRRNNRNFRNSRFDQPQNFNQNRQNNQQNQNQNPNERPNIAEVRPEPVVATNNAVKQEVAATPVAQPVVVKPVETPKPAATPAPAQSVTPAVQQQPLAQQPRQQQPQSQQQRPQQTQVQQAQQPQQQAQQQRSQQPNQQQRQQQNQPQNQSQNQPQNQPQNQRGQQQQRQQPQTQQQQEQVQQSQQQQTGQANSTASKANDANSVQTANSAHQQGQQNQNYQQGQYNQQYQQHQQQQHYNQNRGQNNQYGNQRGGGGGFKRQLQDKGSSGGGGGAGGNREEHSIVQKLRDIAGPTIELAPLEMEELRFSGRSRLYIGNLTNDITDQELQEMFTPYGETAELFINKEKNFAFIRIDYRANAEKARRELDGSLRKGRALRVRFAPQNSAIKVSNLTPQVSNELLHKSFEVFGKIERALVKADDRGKSLCEGIVEYARKASAMTALRYCTERCYFITSSLRPVIVEPFDEIDEVDGYPEKTLPKKNPDYLRAREVGPRFADLSSFEHEYGTRWKQLHELYRQKEEALKAELADERDKLEAQMELARYEQETEMLREALRRREAERERATLRWSSASERRDAERNAAAATGLERGDRASSGLRQDDMATRMRSDGMRPDDDLRRRPQESTLFMQAQQLNSLLDQQEQGLGVAGYEAGDAKRGFEQGLPGSIGLDGGFLDHGRQYGSADRAYEGDMMARWRHDDFPNKRRRY